MNRCLKAICLVQAGLIVTMLCLSLDVACESTDAVEFVVPNGDFGQGLEGWSALVMKQRAAATVVERDGDPCLFIQGEAGSRVKTTRSVAIEPARWYRVGFRYLAGPNGIGGGAMGHFRAALFDANGKFIDYQAHETLIDTFDVWRRVGCTLKAPLSAVRLQLEFNSSGASDLYVDDVTLEACDAPSRAANTWAELTEPRELPVVFSSWQYNSDAAHFGRMGLKYGWHYRHGEQFDQLKATRTVPFWRGEDVYAEYAKRGIKACVYLYYGALDYRKKHYGGDVPADVAQWIDPVWHDGYVATCRKACEEYAETPGISYFFVADEPYYGYIKSIIPKAERESIIWEELDAEVRERYGAGQHGLPEGPDDENPHRWMAYMSWATDQLVDTFRRLREVIDASECNAKLLGPDELSCLCAERWCDLARYVDVFTGQALATRHGGRAYRSGFLTKAIADFTGKPVHSATQIVAYGGSPSPEEVQRQYSQVLQSGGEGQMLIAVEWFDRELNHHQYSAPERWATITNFLDLMAHNRVQTPDDAQVGILCSSPSVQAAGPRFSTVDAPYEVAYALCGPVLGAWPRLIDSYAVAQGKASLEGLRILLVPYAPYERREGLEEVQEFARSGGLVVCLDPKAFSTDLLGEALPSEALFGVKASEREAQRFVDISWPESGRMRAYDTAAYTLEPVADGVEVIGRHTDGAAAVTKKPVGKGHAILFGANPLGDPVLCEDQEWQSWCRSLLAGRNVPMNLPIWNLRLPDEALVQAEAPKDVCVTGNSYVRCQNGVYLRANDRVNGHYILSVPPDLSPETALKDAALGGRVPFSQGDLTDRTDADKGPFEPRTRKAKSPYVEAEWANRWSAEALENGLTIDFTLPQPRQLNRVRFWFSGTQPELAIEGITGDTTKEMARVPTESASADVVEIEVPITGTFATVRMRFGPSNGPFALADVELWAQPN